MYYQLGQAILVIGHEGTPDCVEVLQYHWLQGKPASWRPSVIEPSQTADLLSADNSSSCQFELPIKLICRPRPNRHNVHTCLHFHAKDLAELSTDRKSAVCASRLRLDPCCPCRQLSRVSTLYPFDVG